jgi:hypothetical protein
LTFEVLLKNLLLKSSKFPPLIRVARLYACTPKIPIWVFLDVLGMEIVGHLIAI